MTTTWQTALKWLGAAFTAALLVGASINGASAHEGKHKIDAKGDKCVRETEFMRRNHMDLLKHQRNDTMRKGIRTTQFSLKGCIDCHASPVNNSVIGTNDNFCQGCHSYAAVKLDCFECHSSKPRPASPATPHPLADAQAGEMQAKAATSGEVSK
ncbi:MAG: hypothetical protein KGZ83_10055 [Sulfuricella sp.]|nr:hypothetical protein [Sulfuricella sp.]